MRLGGWIVLALLGACGAPATAARVATTSGDEGAPEGGNGNGAPVPDASAQSTTATQTGEPDEILVSGHGFTPQPALRSGTAGATDGARDGASFSAECVGQFPSTPQHVIKLGGPVELLRIVADAVGDLTLAVRTPDGVFHCNDDSGDPANVLNPTVELERPPVGTIEVWVGTFSSFDAGAAYRLGVTEQPGPPSSIVRR